MSRMSTLLKLIIIVDFLSLLLYRKVQDCFLLMLSDVFVEAPLFLQFCSLESFHAIPLYFSCCLHFISAKCIN